MARCSRGLRPANNVSAAPSIGISTGSGINADAVLMRDPPSLLACPSSRALQPRQRIQFIRRVGVLLQVGFRPVVLQRGAVPSGELRNAGHTVHTPDFYDGNVFDTLDDGLAYAKHVGFGEILERGVRAADGLPAELVYAGFSMGVMAAQKLAQTRPGARGALLYYSALLPDEFGSGWPDDVPVQIHAMDADPFFVGEGDIDAARALVASAKQAELFLYPGDGHLFADSSLPSYDPDAAALLMRRTLEFLATL